MCIHNLFINFLDIVCLPLQMGLHRLLVPAVGIAGSLAAAMTCTNTTVHAAEERMPKLYKPSEVFTFVISLSTC